MQGLLRVYKRQIGRRNFLKLFEFAKTGDWDKVRIVERAFTAGGGGLTANTLLL